MKMISFSRVLIMGVIVSGVLLGGCKKDDEFTIAKCLSDTDWNVTTFQANGFPILGNVYSSVTIEFGKYNKADQKGAVSFEYININGTVRKETGTFTIDESRKEIVVTITVPQAFLPITYATTCTKGGDLTLEGNVQTTAGFENWKFIARQQ